MGQYKSVSQLEKDVQSLEEKISLDIVARLDEDKLALLVFSTIASSVENKDTSGLLYMKKLLLQLYKEHIEQPDERSSAITVMCKVGIRTIKQFENGV